jgi:hypothetical protein
MIRHRKHNRPVVIASPPCPVCGAFMVEEDRVVDGDTAYVWYACSKAGCGGQRLSQLSAPPSIWDWAKQTRKPGACASSI